MLLGVNVCLLVLMAGRNASSARYQASARDEAVSILDQNGIAVDKTALPKEMSLPPMTVTRDPEAEAAQIAGLLGEVSRSEDGAASFTGERGTARFSADGTFSVSLSEGAYPLNGAVPGRVGLECLSKMGFDAAGGTWDETSGTLSVLQTWEDAPIFSCQATLTFEEEELCAIRGTRLIGAPVFEGGDDPLTVATVLLQFLAYLKESGTICREISGITAGYTLSTVQINPVHLLPIWQITTDSESYYMDAVTGAVTVAD